MEDSMVDDSAPSHRLITDSFLLSILRTTYSARDAALALLEVSSNPPPDSTPLTPPPEDDAEDEDKPPSNLAHLLAISRSQKQLFAHLAQLRGLNRKLAHAVRNTKAETSASRAEVDTLHLSLQNLYYESRHLAGEIGACEGFPHKYTELPLVSEDEFLQNSPEWVERRKGRPASAPSVDTMDASTMAEDGMANNAESTKQEQETTDDDQWGEEGLMKARIEAEYQERVRLEEERKKLVSRKMELVRENAKRKEELGKLDKELEAFIEAAKPIQKTFEKDL